MKKFYLQNFSLISLKMTQNWCLNHFLKISTSFKISSKIFNEFPQNFFAFFFTISQEIPRNILQFHEILLNFLQIYQRFSMFLQNMLKFFFFRFSSLDSLIFSRPFFTVFPNYPNFCKLIIFPNFLTLKTC